jgi:hypothetical protein
MKKRSPPNDRALQLNPEDDSVKNNQRETLMLLQNNADDYNAWFEQCSIMTMKRSPGRSTKVSQIADR